MNIAVIAKVAHPIKEPFSGGLESFTHMICEQYAAYGHSVTLYAHRDSDPAFTVISFNDPSNFRGKHASQYEADEYLAIVKDIESKQFDVVHNNSVHSLPLIWGARSTIPMITTLHTPPYSALKAVSSLSSYSSNLHFVSVSKSLRKSWQPFIHSHISVIHNGIHTEQWHPTAEKEPYLFWYGRILHNKGLDIALDLAHDLKAPLYFAGPIADTSYFDTQITPRIKESDTYLGHLTQKEINTYLSKARALVNSARWEEPFGLSTAEAMAAGTPVIGFDRGALREIIQEKGGAVATGTTVQSLKEALHESETIHQKTIVDQSRHFGIQRMVKQYLEYFEELL